MFFSYFTLFLALLSFNISATSLEDVRFSYVGEDLTACLLEELQKQSPDHLSEESFPLSPLPERFSPPIFKRLGSDQGKEVIDRQRISLSFLVEAPSYGNRRSLYSIDIYSESSEGWKIENRTHGFPGLTHTKKMSLTADLFKVTPGRVISRIDLSPCADHFFGPVLVF